MSCAVYFNLHFLARSLLSEKIQDHKSLMALAVSRGNDDMVRVVLESPKFTPDTVLDEKRTTTLHYAADRGQTRIVETLLHVGASINLPNSLGESPLSLASKYGHESVVQVLLSTVEDARQDHASTCTDLIGKECLQTAGTIASPPGQDIRLDDRECHATSSAAIAGNAEHSILAHTAETTIQDDIELGRLEKSSSVERRIDVNMLDHEKKSALSHAIGKGREVIVRLLLAVPCIYADQRDVRGKTPLALLCSGSEAEWRSESIKMLLHTRQVDPDSEDNSRNTPLYHAVVSNNTAAVRFQAETDGVDVNRNHYIASSPFRTAVTQGSVKIIEALLATGKVSFFKDCEDENSEIDLQEALWEMSRARPGSSLIRKAVAYLPISKHKQDTGNLRDVKRQFLENARAKGNFTFDRFAGGL